MNELVRRDLLTCLGTWLALEVVCFGLLPAIGLARSQFNTEPWLIASLPLGIGGAFLLASGTQITERVIERATERRRTNDRLQRIMMKLSSLLLSWAGLIGIGFPILITTALIFLEIFSRLRGE